MIMVMITVAAVAEVKTMLSLLLMLMVMVRMMMISRFVNTIFFSWNIGPVHIISFSTELYYFLKYGIEPLIQQYKWLQKDLEVMNTFTRLCFKLAPSALMKSHALHVGTNFLNLTHKSRPLMKAYCALSFSSQLCLRSVLNYIVVWNTFPHRFRPEDYTKLLYIYYMCDPI